MITEIMARSWGDDSLCEWFEVGNLSGATLDLSEVEITDRGLRSAWFPEGATLAPFEVGVAGRSEGAPCGLEADWVLEGDFGLADGTLLITHEQPDAADRFREAVAVGAGSYGLEMGLEAATLVYSYPFYEMFNGSFLDEESTSLTIVLVSAEDDMSPHPVATYVDELASLKGDAGHREPGRVELVAITGTQAPEEAGGPSCSSELGEAAYGQHYLEAVRLLGGRGLSICEPFDDVLPEIGLTASGLDTEFALSSLPDLATLVVELYADIDQPEPERELVRGLDFEVELRPQEEDWVMLLVFPDEAPPPSESVVVADYIQLPLSADPAEVYPELTP